jgi:6-phosphogluconate dehydrogenase
LSTQYYRSNNLKVRVASNNEKRPKEIAMEIGLIGLGKMGANMAVRLLKGGHHVVVHDINEASIQVAEKEGAEGARTLDQLVEKLNVPRLVWLMVPSGKITEETIFAVAELFTPGDTIIDGGNSNYKDSMRHSDELNEKGINFVDVGTSGGIWGLNEGYSMMIGGKKEIVDRYSPIFETLAPASDKGWGYVGLPDQVISLKWFTMVLNMD